MTGRPRLPALSFPTGLAISASGDLFIADTGNYRVREVLPPSPLQVLAATQISDVTAAELNSVASSSPSFTLQAPTADDLTDLISAVNGITEPTASGAPQPVTVTLDLAANTTYNDANIALQPGVTLVIVGNGTSTTFVGPLARTDAHHGQSGGGRREFLHRHGGPHDPRRRRQPHFAQRHDFVEHRADEPAFEVTGGAVDLGNGR